MAKINLTFNLNEGNLTTENNYSVKVFGDGARPYDLLFASLGSCFYHTFNSVAEKKRLSFDGVKLEISGTKREEVPTVLEHVVMNMVIVNPSNKEQLLKSAELGAKYCSIHETISKVAKIDLNVSFE